MNPQHVAFCPEHGIVTEVQYGRCRVRPTPSVFECASQCTGPAIDALVAAARQANEVLNVTLEWMRNNPPITEWGTIDYGADGKRSAFIRAAIAAIEKALG
jgi:hypothetical protein